MDINLKEITMKKIKKYLATAALALVFTSAMAQDNKHEISVSVGGGTAGFNPKMISKGVLDIKKDNGNGVNFGIGYAYNLSESFALVSGIHIDMFKSEFKLNEFGGNYMSVDSENDGFLLQYSANGYKEEIKATYLNIPLMARYTYNLNDSWGLFVSGGAKIGFVLSSKYNNKLESVTAQGAYVQWGNGSDIPTIDDIELEGFGTFNGLSSSDDLDLKTKFTAAAEIGARYKINTKYSIYFGGYIDYTLNNIRGSEAKDMIQYDGYGSQKININSMAESLYKDEYQLVSTKAVSKLKPLSLGIKVHFAFGL